MGDDDLVLLVLALLWRLLDSLADAAVWGALSLTGIVAAAALILWAGRALPTGSRARGGTIPDPRAARPGPDRPLPAVPPGGPVTDQYDTGGDRG